MSLIGISPPLSDADSPYSFLGGVSRTLNLSYLRPLPTDTTIIINAHVVQLGRTLAMLRGEILDPEGKVYVACEHHKVRVPIDETPDLTDAKGGMGLLAKL